MPLVAITVVSVQWLWSPWWLRRYHYGPLEWFWHWATWARRPPMRRHPVAPDGYRVDRKETIDP